MVSLPRGRRGASKLGCLFTVLLFGVTLMYGVEVGRIYYRYYSLRDTIRSEARFASNKSDQAIRRTLIDRIDELGIPAEAKRMVVRRTGPPYLIRIRTEYREELDLPFGVTHTIVFRPTVESRF